MIPAERGFMPKKTTDFPYVGVRPSERTYAAVLARTETGTGAGTVAREALDWYFAILAHALPAFSEGEALFLARAMNGARYTPESASHLIRDVAGEWAERPDPSIDGASLLARLRSLSYAELAALIDAIKQIWLGEYRKSADELRRRLRDVGLVQEEGVFKQ